MFRDSFEKVIKILRKFYIFFMIFTKYFNLQINKLLF